MPKRRIHVSVFLMASLFLVGCTNESGCDVLIYDDGKCRKVVIPPETVEGQNDPDWRILHEPQDR